MFRPMLNAGLIALIAAVLGFSFVQSRAENPDKPAAKQKEKAEKPKKVHVNGDFGKIELTDDQKTQIAAIQADTSEKIKALRQEEETKIQSLLNDEQKAQITKIREEAAAKQKEKNKERYEKTKQEKAEKDKKTTDDVGKND